MMRSSDFSSLMSGSRERKTKEEDNSGGSIRGIESTLTVQKRIKRWGSVVIEHEIEKGST